MNIFLPNTSTVKDFCLMFMQNGFSNWKKALVRFKYPAALNLHCVAMSRTAAVKRGVGVNVAACVIGKQNEMKDKESTDNDTHNLHCTTWHARDWHCVAMIRRK